MKVIFLDIDGVLNAFNKNSKSRCGEYSGIDKARVKLLSSLVAETGAILVLTSTWKYHWTSPYSSTNLYDTYLNRHLKNKGNLYITDKTREANLAQRGMGIKEYLSRHPEVDGWVVLDDEIFDDYQRRGIFPHLICINSKYGIQEEDVAAAVKILNGELIGPYNLEEGWDE